MMLTVSLSATTIVVPSDEQLVAKSPVIVRGTVVSTVVVERDGGLWTETVLAVEQTLKGKTSSQIVIREMGGETEDRITKIFGSPEYKPGQHVLAFVTPAARGDYQTVDLFIGKFEEAKTLDGRRLWMRGDRTANVRLLDANFKELEATNVQRDAAGFERFIGARNAGRAAASNYGVENPVIDSPALRNNTAGRLSNDFTLIQEPTVSRWFEFDAGATEQWFSYGQQTGYSGGGANEIRTGMAAWTGFSQARILYSYVGAASGTPTTLETPNGVNDIVFNDARGEISGSWSPSTGGVVGQGGFNASGARSWTSSFAADATHTQRTFTSFAISEGHMTIQDGVSPANGISSSELAEIIAHEFGHTLGFGHSSDNSALMFFQVTGLGPSLRADDQLAARWLYPSGSSPNPGPGPAPVQIPNAPSNLAATPSGTSVILTWNDNASNETGQSIYVAAGSGSFQKVGDVGTNVRTATLSGFSNGQYRIHVTASNSAGESAASNVVTVTISTQGVNANFTVSPTSGIVGVTNFIFTDTSTGPVASRSWEFGDGTSSNAANPTHVYTITGQFTVALTVAGGGTSSTITRLVTVTAPVIPLVASFSFSPSNPTTSTNVVFTDSSTGGVTAWVWNFGDGSSSSQQNPSKRYLNAGTYNVVLTVFRNTQTAVASSTITVTAPAPVTPAISAEFEFSPSNPDVGTSVAFTDRSAGSPTSWLWSFGDGAASSSKNPTHTFNAPGTYFVTLTASNAGSSGNVTHAITVVPRVLVYRSLIPVATQTTGQGGANWRTELSLFNAGDEGANVRLDFIPGAGGATLMRSVFVSPRQSIVYANALLDLFGLTNSAGGIAIQAEGSSSTPSLKVASRTFTNGARGTYGQAVPDIDAAAFGQTLYLTGLESDAEFRTNIGIVNKGNAPVPVTLTLFNSDGVVLGTKSLTIPANNFGQTNLAGHFPVVSGVQHRILSMQVTAAANDAISVYASVINNETSDPVYIQAIPAVKNNRLVIPVIGRLPGVNGTFFRSDVTYFNPTLDTMTLSTRYLPSGSDNRNASARTLTLGPGRTTVQADILSSLGLTAGVGALEITWNGGDGPIVTSRTYTSTETGGTFGQSIDPIQSFATRIDVTGMRSDASFRSNVGFVNGGDATIGINVTLLSASGQALRTASIQLAPKSQSQYQLAGLFSGLDAGSVGSFTLRAEASAPTMFAYGSIVDNGSGDAVFFAGR